MLKTTQYVISAITSITMLLCLGSCFKAKQFEAIKKNQIYQDVEQVNLLITNYCPTQQRELFYAFNRNLKLTEIGFDLDSDGDGVSDNVEKFLALEYGVKSSHYDANNDHYPDSVIIRSGLKLNQQSVLPTLGSIDTDGDDLADGLEQYLGTNPKDADTDQDGISDELEIYLGTNPVLADTNQDTDLDGISNLKEISQLTPLDQTNPGNQHIEKYTVIQEQFPQPNRAGCYHYLIKGFPIYTALENNWLQLVYVEQQAGVSRQWRHFNLRVQPNIELLYKNQNLERSEGVFPTLELSFEDIEKAKEQTE